MSQEKSTTYPSNNLAVPDNSSMHGNTRNDERRVCNGGHKCRKEMILQASVASRDKLRNTARTPQPKGSINVERYLRSSLLLLHLDAAYSATIETPP